MIGWILLSLLYYLLEALKKFSNKSCRFEWYLQCRMNLVRHKLIQKTSDLTILNSWWWWQITITVTITEFLYFLHYLVFWKEHILETGSTFILGENMGNTWSGPSEIARPNHWVQRKGFSFWNAVFFKEYQNDKVQKSSNSKSE